MERMASVLGWCSVVFLTVSALPPPRATALAHGGRYRGPAGQMPATGRLPMDPPVGTPPPIPLPGEGGPATGTTRPPIGRLPQAGPHLPTRLGPPGKDGLGGGRRGGSTPGPHRKPSTSDAFAGWGIWWSYNREPYLRLRERIRRAREAHSGAADWLLGNRRRGEPATVHRVRPRLVEGRVIPALSKALEDGYFDVRAAAAIALGKTGRKGVLPSLVRALADPHQQVSESAALAIGILGEPDGIALLRELLLDSRAGRVLVRRPGGVPYRTRAFAGVALGLIGEPSVVPVLLRAADTARSERHRDVPIGALFGLGLLGRAGEKAVAPLVALLSSRSLDDLTRSYVVLALGRIGDRAALPSLRRVLRDRPGLHTLRSAVLALGRLGTPGDRATFHELSRVLHRSGDPQARHWACISLGEIGGREARKLLTETLVQREGPMRAFGALGLAVLARRSGTGGEVARTLREGLATTRDESTRGALAIALGIVGDADSAPRLAAILHGRGSPMLRGHAAVALGMIGARSAAAEMRRVAAAPATDPDLRRSAATALGLLGDRGVARLLSEVIRRAGSEYVMNSAAFALGRIGDASAIDPLIDLLQDPRAAGLTRAQAAVALGMVAEEGDLPALDALSADSNYRAQVEAIRELLDIS